jgi:hypothetical protein
MLALALGIPDSHPRLLVPVLVPAQLLMQPH